MIENNGWKKKTNIILCVIFRSSLEKKMLIISAALC